jgi:hypothetical protein
MKQKGASPIIPILVIAILAIGGYLYFGKKDGGMMVKNEPGSQQGIAVGEPNPAQPKPAIVTGNPDDVIAAIGASLDEEIVAADASTDADFVNSDTDAINSYADAYDTTNF